MCEYFFVNTHIHILLLILKMQRKWDLWVVFCQLDGKYIYYTKTTTWKRAMLPKDGPETNVYLCPLWIPKKSHSVTVCSEILDSCSCQK